jgi:hypothetical protein
MMSANYMATAQTQPKISKRYFVHELSAYASAGLASIGYKLDLGSRSNGFGAGLGFNYAYNINDKFAVTSGLGFKYYSGKLKMNGYGESYSSVDDNGDDFNLEYHFDGEYREKQNAVLLTIPVMARFSTPLGNSPLKYYVSGGFKLGIPFAARATITPGTVSTSGYYEYEARTYTNLFEHGFINGYPGEKSKSRIRLGVTPMLALETGVRLPIGYKLALTGGLYIDYNFINIKKSKNKHVLEYQSLLPMQFIYNSVLNTASVKRITLFDTGLKVGIIF